MPKALARAAVWAEIPASIRWDHTDFRRRCPRLAVDLGDGAQFYEAAFPGLKVHRLLPLASLERAFLHRLAKILAIVAQVKFVILDGAILTFVLARQVSECFQCGRLSQFNNDFVRTLRIGILPFRVPE